MTSFCMSCVRGGLSCQHFPAENIGEAVLHQFLSTPLFRERIASVKLPPESQEPVFSQRVRKSLSLVADVMDQSLADRWQQHLSLINSALQEALPSSSLSPQRLNEAMSYSLLAGGKRLRPVLVLLTCEACGGTARDALPAACAIEMIHTYSLIHDDLPSMDNDDLRRGKPTNHKVFGEAMAILAGDSLLTRAFELVAARIQPADVAAACCVDLAVSAGAEGMVGGQVADLEAETCPPTGDREIDGKRLIGIHRRKTGALIACAASLGARIAGASPTLHASLITYGENIGVAFQIADDLLDIIGNSDKMGKGVAKDASLGKLTYPGVYGIEKSRKQALDHINAAINAVSTLGTAGRPLTALAEFVLARDH